MKLVPEQNLGSKSDNFSTVTEATKEEAIVRYKNSCNRLFDVNNWKTICNNILKATFVLCDEEGNAVNRMPKENDFFRIDIPGPGSATGEGFDWVQVEKISSEDNESDDVQRTSIRVRPASCPLNSNEDVAHFFEPSATSTFIITRKGNIVTAEIHGRNEVPNNSKPKTLDALRNTVTANVAIAALSDIQWKDLCKAFVSA